MAAKTTILNNIQARLSAQKNYDSIGLKLKDSLYEFVKHFWNTISTEKFVDNFHIRVLCNILQKEGVRIKKRLPKIYEGIVINIPPGTTKTTIVLIMFPAWLFAIDPSIRIISASHSMTLSKKANIASRDIIESYEYKNLFPYVILKDDFNTQVEYRTTKNGVRQATSPDSKVTGDHAHIILYDDLVDPKDVESAKKLPGVIRWLDRTISSREVNKMITSHIMIMQRLGAGDPSEHFRANRKNVLHIKLPAVTYMVCDDGEVLEGEVKPPYLKRKYKNGLLDPNRLPKSVINLKKSIMTPLDFFSQFMQDTEMDTGKVLKKEYFEIVNPMDLPESFWTDAIMYFFVDSAQTDSKKNDPFGCLVATVFNGQLYLVDYFKDYLKFSFLINKLREIFKRYATLESVMFIEPKSNGKDIVDYFQVHTTFNVVEWDMLKGGKYERLSVVEPSVRSRGVKVIRGEWVKPFIKTVTNFPDPSIVHDEEVDVFTMASAEAYLEGRDYVRNVKNVKF